MKFIVQLEPKKFEWSEAYRYQFRVSDWSMNRCTGYNTFGEF